MSVTRRMKSISPTPNIRRLTLVFEQTPSFWSRRRVVKSYRTLGQVRLHVTCLQIGILQRGTRIDSPRVFTWKINIQHRFKTHFSVRPTRCRRKLLTKSGSYQSCVQPWCPYFSPATGAVNSLYSQCRSRPIRSYNRWLWGR